MRAASFFLAVAIAGLVSCNKHTAQGSNVVDEIDNKGFSTPKSYDGYKLLWNDEFDGSSVDEANWSFETGRGGNGWGNNELQYYTKENASVQNGYLVITAKKEDKFNASYTSTRMITKNKKEFLYGRIDIRARVPEGQGIWPALWMLGSDIDSIGWPLSGEIDIMEIVGHEANKVYGTLHWGATDSEHRSKGYWNVLASGKYSDEFHVYSLIWKEDQISILVDDHEYFVFTSADAEPDSYPFNKPFYLLFNVAVGGNWPGSPDATTVFPQKMIVDYVRVFQPQ